MTSKLRCPFCKEEIISDLCLMCDKIDKGYTSGRQIYKCNKCGLCGNKELWQELIRTRKALEIARKALEYYADSRFGKKQDDGTYALEIDKGCGVTVVYTYDPRLAKQTLEQIEHKE